MKAPQPDAGRRVLLQQTARATCRHSGSVTSGITASVAKTAPLF